MSETVEDFRAAVVDKLKALVPTVRPGVFREAEYSSPLEFIEPASLYADTDRTFQVVSKPDYGPGVFFGGYDVTGYVEILIRYDRPLRTRDDWLTLTQMVATDAVQIKQLIGSSPNATAWPGLAVCNVRTIKQEGPLKSAKFDGVWFLRLTVEYRFET